MAGLVFKEKVSINRHLHKAMEYKIGVKQFIIFILLFTIISGTLVSSFGAPSAILYLNDALLLIAFVFGFRKIVSTFKWFPIIVSISLTVCFTIFILSSFLSMVSPLLVLWATRNTFRGIVYLFLVISYIKIEDFPRLFNFLLILQMISLALALYQFIVLKHEQDRIGGIFGYGNGAGVNTFNILMMAYYLHASFAGKEKKYKAILCVVSSFIIAGVAEEKATFVYFVILVVCLLIFSKISFLSKFSILLLSFIGFSIGLTLLKEFYPTMYETMTNLDSFLSYSTATYDSGYRIPRIGAFNVISQLFFHSPKDILFGIGFGNGETSSFSFLQSEFYTLYGQYNYRWFTHQWVFLETGIVGFLSYLSIFISILWVLLSKTLKYRNQVNSYLGYASISCLLCMIVSIWYNATLKVDMSYIAYFSIAFGIVWLKNLQQRRVISF